MKAAVKKMISVILLLFLLAALLPVHAEDSAGQNAEGIYMSLCIGGNEVLSNGAAKTLHSAPFMENGFAFVPLRETAELCGGIVKYIPDDQSVMIALRKQSNSGQAYFSQIWIGTNRVVNNGSEESAMRYWMYSAGKRENYGAIVREGHVFVPANYFERFGFASVWNTEDNRIIMKSQADESDQFRYLVEPVLPFDHEYLSVNDGLLSIEKDGKFGFMDQTGKVMISPQYDANTYFSEGVAWFRENEKYGLVDSTGRLVIAPQYDDVSGFSQGLAEVTKDGKTGFIDKAGKVVVPLIYDNDSRSHCFCGELAVVYKDRKYGFVDKTGREVIAPQYDIYLNDYGDRCFTVCKEETWGVVDNTGKEIMLPQYDYINTFQNGFSTVQKNDKVGLIDQTGREVVAVGRYDSIYEVCTGIARVAKNGKFGFIDTAGKEIIAPQYDDASDFGEGIAAVRKDGKWIIIDTAGREEVALSYDYNSIDSFRNGLAQVYKNGQCGLIDTEGREMLPPVYYSISEFQDGLAVVMYDGYVSGVINQQGEFVAPLSFDRVAICDSKTAFVRKDGCIGIISLNGTKEIIPG